MFQSFDHVVDFSQSAARVDRLRRILSDEGVDGMLVPRADEHQGEYVPASAARLAWLTGFTGSAGVALVLRERAFILVDGRYTVQVRSEVDLAVFEPQSSVETTLPDFLAREAGGLRIAIDPWLHAMGEVEAIGKALGAKGGSLVPLTGNPVDRIWNDRPPAPKGLVSLYPDALAGRTAAEKLATLDDALVTASADAAVLSDPSSIAWALNIRGSDVPHTPLPLSFAVLRQGQRPQLFIEADKLTPEVGAALASLADVEAPDAFERALRGFGGRTVMLDPALVASRIGALVEEGGGTVLKAPDPARLPRAVKSAAEIEGARAAHLRDGGAVTAFLHWLDGQAPGSLSEIAAAERLEAIRAEHGAADGMALRDISFDTIAGSGPNGAIVHYRVNRESDRVLGAGELFLIDSGAQYLDGTTDITRTVPIGTPTTDMREKFTLVLKGMIAISTARFPKGTRGVDLDPLARIALWTAGCDYAHGTGHGVGAYLSVHEGPQSISRRGMAVLEPGMILSNEPGYYRQGAFGIRIENLVLTEAASDIPGGDMPMLGFETLTLAPIDRRLVVAALLETRELDWLNAYHRRVRATLSPRLQPSTRDWLGCMTEPILADRG